MSMSHPWPFCDVRVPRIPERGRIVPAGSQGVAKKWSSGRKIQSIGLNVMVPRGTDVASECGIGERDVTDKRREGSTRPLCGALPAAPASASEASAGEPAAEAASAAPRTPSAGGRAGGRRERPIHPGREVPE